MGDEVKENHVSSQALQKVLFSMKLEQKRADIELPNLEKFEPKARPGDKITALQELVSPFGKSDTASVLLETIGYIKFLLGQVEALSTHEHHDSITLAENKGFGSLRSRGLCLVPVMILTNQESDLANCPLQLAEFFESKNGKNREPPRGLDDEVTKLQPLLAPYTKVNIKSPELEPTMHFCDGLAIDIRHVNYAHEIGATCIGKNSTHFAKHHALMNFLIVALILVMLVFFYLPSDPSVIDNRFFKSDV